MTREWRAAVGSALVTYGCCSAAFRYPNLGNLILACTGIFVLVPALLSRGLR